MKRSVTFGYGDGTGEMIGFEGGTLPIDKMAELVLSSGNNPINEITVNFVNGGRPAHWSVKWASEVLPGVPCRLMNEVNGPPICFWSGLLIEDGGFCRIHGNA